MWKKLSLCHCAKILGFVYTFITIIMVPVALFHIESRQSSLTYPLLTACTESSVHNHIWAWLPVMLAFRQITNFTRGQNKWSLMENFTTLKNTTHGNNKATSVYINLWEHQPKLNTHLALFVFTQQKSPSQKKKEVTLPFCTGHGHQIRSGSWGYLLIHFALPPPLTHREYAPLHLQFFEILDVSLLLQT